MRDFSITILRNDGQTVCVHLHKVYEHGTYCIVYNNSYCYIGPMVRSRSLLAVLLARDEALELSLELALEGGLEDWRRVMPPALEGPLLLLMELVLLRGDIPVK